MQQTGPVALAPPPAAANSTVDRLGAVASGLCAAHCAASALLPSVLSAMGLGALLGHEAEWGFTIVAVVLAAAALILGWRRHQSRPVMVLLGAGITGLVASRLVEEAGIHGVGTAIGVAAGLILVVGHIGNIRASRQGHAGAA